MKGARGVLINITGGTRHDAVRGRRGGQPDPRGGRSRSQHHLRLDLRREAGRPDAHLGRRRPASMPSCGAGAGSSGARRRDRRAATPACARRLRLYPADLDAERRAAVAPQRAAARPAAHRGAEKRVPRPGEARPSRRRPPPRRRKTRRCAAAPLSRRSRSMPARPDRCRSAQPAVPPAAARAAARPKGRVPSLIERVTGVGRGAPCRAGAAAPRRRARAAARPPPRRRSRASTPLESGAAARRQQGRRSARHPRLPAPPGELECSPIEFDREFRRPPPGSLRLRGRTLKLLLPRNAGEGDRAKQGGGGWRAALEPQRVLLAALPRCVMAGPGEMPSPRRSTEHASKPTVSLARIAANGVLYPKPS